MNYILLLIRQMQKLSRKNKALSSEINQNQNAISVFSNVKNLSNHENDLITSKNFPFIHLCNRDIRDLPLSTGNSLDFNRLRSCSILTMTDLIGRYLIHKTSEEFRKFLIEKVQCNQSFVDEIIQLIDIWIGHNLQIGRETQTLKQYL